MEPRLAKRVSATNLEHKISPPMPGFGPRAHAKSSRDSFTSKLMHLCDKFSDNVKILEIDIDDENCMKPVYQVLKNSCPNLKNLGITGYFKVLNDQSNICSLENSKLRKALKIQNKLTHYTLSSNRVTPYLPIFTQLVFDASPYLKEIVIPFGIYPNLVNLQNLTDITIGLEGVTSNVLNNAEMNLRELTKMLRQVGEQLVNLSFGDVDRHEKKTIEQGYDAERMSKLGFHLPQIMPKLKHFRNEMIDIFQCGDSLQDISERMPSLINYWHHVQAVGMLI